MKVKIIVCIKVKLQRKKNWRAPSAPSEQPELNGKDNRVTDGAMICMEKTPDDMPDGAMVIFFSISRERRWKEKRGEIVRAMYIKNSLILPFST